MRVAENMLSTNLMNRIQEIQKRLFDRQNQVASGKKLTRPSHDPVGSGRVIRIRDQMSQINQYFRNINQVRLRLAVSEDSLNSMRNLLLQAAERTGFALNGTLSQDARNVIADEIDSIRDSMVRIAETQVDGKFIYSGSRVDVPPVELEEGIWVYRGDDLLHQVEISQGKKIEGGFPASELFTAEGADVLNRLDALAEALRNGDLSTAQVLFGELDEVGRLIDTVRARMGAGINETDRARVHLDDLLLSLTEEVMHLEDADIAEAVQALVQNETALRATLASGARSHQISLFDFMA